MRLRQIGRGPAQDLVLLLEQLDPPRCFPSSALSWLVVPGLVPSSTSARRIHFHNVIGWTPKSVATCSTVTPGPRFLATRTTSWRNSSG